MEKVNRRIILILAVPAVILLLPLIAMQFTKEVKWSFFDFAIAGLLLFNVSFICELVFRNVKQSKNRILLIGLLLIVLTLIWLELAVGIFGSPFAGN